MTDELDLRAMRETYALGELTETGVAITWFEQFEAWFAAAEAEPAIREANAIQLATADADGHPDVRTVLAKTVTEDGLVFYTHYNSPKGRDLIARPWAAALFAWLPLQRQVRLSGPVTRNERAETEAYFSSRPRGSQVGAWASAATGQSAVVAGRPALDNAVADVESRFVGEATLPAPPEWGGYRLAPVAVEFWQGRDNRIHDRIRYRAAGDRWVIERLAP